jgi:hypothetical protein
MFPHLLPGRRPYCNVGIFLLTSSRVGHGDIFPILYPLLRQIFLKLKLCLADLFIDSFIYFCVCYLSKKNYLFLCVCILVFFCLLSSFLSVLSLFIVNNKHIFNFVVIVSLTWNYHWKIALMLRFRQNKCWVWQKW